MNIQDYTFVALDLETTGLDTSTCRVIEIAAVKFTLGYSKGKYTILTREERTMLIDPEIEITNEVTMITGIDASMIYGKSKWHEVEHRVKDFISDAVIVGHNVLFDIEVLKNHGLHLSKKEINEGKSRLILDTFELSEIFSQDIESLNLAFLSNRYGFGTPGEHRALDDTIMSMELFLYYLNNINNLDKKQKSIILHLEKYDQSGIMHFLGKLLSREELVQIEEIIPTSSVINQNQEKKTRRNTNPNLNIFSYSGGSAEEISYLKHIKKEGDILLLVYGRKQIPWIEGLLDQEKITHSQFHPRENYISTERLSHILSKNAIWSRKYTILVCKLLFWLQKTKNGILAELKYYGDEYVLLEEFRAIRDESNTFIETSQKLLDSSNFVIADVLDALGSNLHLDRLLVVRDIEKIEESMRIVLSREIDFGSFKEALYKLENDIGNTLLIDKIFWSLSHIEAIFLNTLSRPSGPLPNPPGDFGETYHLTQSQFWNSGNRWSILNMELLEDLWEESIESISEAGKKENGRYIKQIREYLEIMSTLIRVKNDNISLIVSIQKGLLKVTIIPRNVSLDIKKYFSTYKNPIFGYGLGLSGPIMKHFIGSEVFQNGSWIGEQLNTPKDHLLTVESTLNEGNSIIKKINTSQGHGCHIILTTNLKYTRELGSILRENFLKIDYDIFIQGISGGKGKMLSNFLASKKKKILIGLIDTWKDEYEIWRMVDTISIMKLPFDPPTDQKFLARTIGMKDNFESYSIPITLSKINTLLGRIISVGYTGKIVCFDDRLITSTWGEKMYKEIL